MRLGIAVLAVVLGVTAFAGSCSYRNDTLNRIVNPYWKKADFDPDTQWYYRTTVVDAPPEAPWISIADGDWLMLERIKWEVTENMLIGWRDYPVVPGTELEQYPGAEDVFRGEPVAMFRITDHFDISNDFDPSTGEVGNIITENRTRLWFDRAFMRVEWSVNMVPTYKWHIFLNQIFNTSAVAQNDPGDPKRYRFENDAAGKLDYFEVTTRTQIMPDIYTYFGWYGIPYMYDPAGSLIDMRHSFMRVPPSDYEPLPMPPTVVLEDEDGNEVRDANGFAQRVPINDRFGFFGTLGRNTFDENRGMVSSGQIFNASRFNIWKNHKNPDGTIIPTDQREAKPIIYYTNVEHPEALQAASLRVAKDWNRTFREVIFELQPTKFTGALDDTGLPADVPEMFILKRNDCNFTTVAAKLDEMPGNLLAKIEESAVRKSYNNDVVPFDGTLADAKARFDHANDPANTLPFTTRQSEETQALNDLERICSALELYSGGDATLGVEPPVKEDGSPIAPFKYQRLGDTRYSLMNLIVGSFQAGWLGLGPPYADPITGETISGTANLAISGLDRSAAYAAQFVSVLNGEVPPTDVTFGFDVEQYMKAKLLQTNALTSLKPTNRAKEEMGVYFDALKQRGGSDVMRDAVGEVPPGRAEALMEKMRGTEFEQKLITSDDIIAFGRVDPLAADGAELDEQLMDAVSPIRGNDQLQKFLKKRERITRMGQRAMDPPEMIDDLLLGRAIALKDLTYEERFKKLREDIYVAVMLHEVGHNVGLFHNMAASSDALNYGELFWSMHDLPADMDDAVDQLASSDAAEDVLRVEQLQSCIDSVAQIGGTSGVQLDPAALNMTTQECLRQTEVMYSSIMDYHANWNSDFGGLGPYDRAAVKFGYGQLVEVFAEGALQDTGGDTRSIKRKIFLDGWQTIPTDIVNGVENVNNREYVKMDWNTSSTRQQPLPNEVPYKFGWGGQLTPDEKPFDFGPDFQTNAKNELNRYFQHYFFTHFARNKLREFDLVDSVINRDIGTMFDFTDKMQWFFFFGATDPDFRGSYAEEDMLGATITGLNLFGKILGHPANGRYITASKADVFGLLPDSPDERAFDVPSDIAIPWTNLGECSTRTIADVGSTVGPNDGSELLCRSDAECAARDGAGAPIIAACDDASGSSPCVCDLTRSQCLDTSDTSDGVYVGARPGFSSGMVPPSEGRPFFIGLTDDYEDWYLTYVGTYWTKIYALLLLGYNYAWFPRADAYADPRIYDVSWYRLFPKEVNKLYWAFITDHTQDIGPTLAPDGTFISRDLLNPDLSTPDYSGNPKVLPSISFNHQYYALLYANVWMSSQTDDTIDLPKAMKVSMVGGNDDTSQFDVALANAVAQSGGTAADYTCSVAQCDAEDVVATFVHPISGLTLRGLKVGETPIAFDLVNRVNIFKERFQRLDACVDAMDDGNPATDLHRTDPYCACFVGEVSLAGDCSGYRIDLPEEGQCQPFALRNRRDSSREIMDDVADYVSDLRTINKYLGWY